MKTLKNWTRFVFLYILGIIDRAMLVPFPFLKSPTFDEILYAKRDMRLYFGIRVVIGVGVLILIWVIWLRYKTGAVAIVKRQK
jgi:hypothetical protein